MKSEYNRLSDYLDHMIQAIERIQKFTTAGKGEFLNSELHQDAVIRNFEIIGEASRNIKNRYPDFAAEHPELPLKFANEMRNVLSHGYFNVDLEIVWNTIDKDIVPLKNNLINIRKQI